MAEGGEKMLRLSLVPAVVMDADVHQGIQTQVDGTVQPHQPGGVRLFGIIADRIAVRIRFHIGCPAFYVTSVV